MMEHEQNEPAVSSLSLGGETNESKRVESKKWHRRLPRELLKQLYPEVLRLRETGLGYKRIIREIQRIYGITLSQGLLWGWVHGYHTPLGDGTRKRPYSPPVTGDRNQKKRRHRPRDLNIQLYHEVLRLREMGLGIKRIIKEIERTHGERLSKSSISYWIRGIHTPLQDGKGKPDSPAPRSYRRFASVEELKPSPDLAYVIGVVFGDGSAFVTHTKSGERRPLITLRVRDRDFVEAFARALGRVLNRHHPPVREQTVNGKTFHLVRVQDATLAELLAGRDIERIRRFVEHDDACRAAFLRGFFDSEGSVGPYRIYAYNTDLRVLKFVREQLMALNIECSEPRLNRLGGRPAGSDGKYITNKDLYAVSIHAASLELFLEKVGFSIERKRQRLEMMVTRRRGRRLTKNEE